MGKEVFIKQAQVLIKNQQGDKALVDAIKQGINDLAIALIENGVTLNKAIDRSETPTRLACQNNNLIVLQTLLENKVTCNHHELLIAVSNKNLPMLTLLLKHGVKSGLDQALALAIKNEDAESAELLFDNGSEALKNKSSDSLLQAINKGMNPLANRLINLGVNINSKAMLDSQETLPLILASQLGNLNIVTSLLTNKANPNLSVVCQEHSPYEGPPQYRYKEFLTPLNEAAKQGHHSIVTQLLTMNATPDKGSLICAAEGKSLEAIQALLARGVTSGIDPALIATIHNNDIPACTLLLQHGANANGYVNDEKVSMLMYALWHNHTSIASILLQYGANVNARTINGFTALMQMAQLGNLRRMAFLLENGADIHIKVNETEAVVETTEIVYAPKEYHYIDDGFVIPGQNFQYYNNSPYSHAVTLRKTVKETQGILGHTALEIALKFNQTDAAQLLLNQGAKPTSRYTTTLTPQLNQAIAPQKTTVDKAVYLKQAKVLVANMPMNAVHLFSSTEQQRTIELGDLLSDTIQQGSQELSIALIEQIEENHTSVEYTVALHTACVHGNLEIVKSLLNKKVTLDFKYNNHQSPIMAAVVHGHALIIKELCANNAPHEAQLLSVAVKNKNTDVLKTLLACEVTQGIDDALVVAADNNDVESCTLLLQYGANPNIKADFYGLDALLIYTIEKKKMAITKILIEYGANVNAVDSRTETPLMAAAKVGDCEIIDLLLNNGANINQIATGYHPGTYASTYITLNHTALDVARNSNQTQAMAFLQARGAQSNVKPVEAVQKTLLNQHAYAGSSNTQTENHTHSVDKKGLGNKLSSFFRS